MTNQLLIPFDAKFILSVNTTIINFFHNSDAIVLEEKYKPLADKLGNVDISKFINYYQLSSKVYKDYEQFGFKFHQSYDVSPSNMLNSINDRDSSLHFKVESFQIQVIQISQQGKEITFIDSNNEVKTVILNENLKLVKV